MPPHIKKRADRKGVYYLVDGRYMKSLGTTVKRFAEHRLEQYVKRQFGFAKGITVSDYFSEWIERKSEPLVRRSAVRDYKQHFTAYILPALGQMALSAVDLKAVERLRNSLLARGLTAKTARNVIVGSLRAMWRDAQADGLVDRVSFAGLRWPAVDRRLPETFTPEERDRILAWTAERLTFYYPFVLFQFATGCRPSEASGLRWADVSLSARTVAIQRSRHLRADNRTKTAGSWRVIQVSDELMGVLEQMRLPWHGENDAVFYNKVSASPLDANEWARIYWRRVCDGAQITRRKFYSTRHTSITEAVKRGENLLAIAQYHGTSVAMIERNYCGALTLGDQTKIKPAFASIGNVEGKSMVPTGLEPGSVTFDKLKQSINQAVRSAQKQRKVG